MPYAAEGGVGPPGCGSSRRHCDTPFRSHQPGAVGTPTIGRRIDRPDSIDPLIAQAPCHSSMAAFDPKVGAWLRLAAVMSAMTARSRA